MRYTRLVENLNSRAKKNTNFRRYTLSEIISESYKMIYDSKESSNMKRLAEAHLEDVRSNPTDLDRLSRQLCNLKYISSMVESKKMKDEELLVPEEKYSKVVPDDKDEDLKESVHDEDVEETDDEDLLEDSDLTDEEVEELTKHLSEIRKSKKVSECDSAKSVKESTKARKMKKKVSESAPVTKTYESLDLSEFNKKSSGKAFVKTFKKLDSQLHEGTALTRQDAISLYKAANSAMTHLSVELEHNPGFLPVFKESTQLLSVDVNKVLGSLAEGKAPGKATMKSLAKFSEALLREAEGDEDEELPPIEDEEEEIIPNEEESMEDADEEIEDFYQEYADARVELHKELAEEFADSETAEVQDMIQQDAEEVASLPGVTEEQAAELLNTESEVSDDEEEELPPEEDPDIEESVHDEDVEETDDEDLLEDDSEITDEELEALKKHLTEMRKAKKIKESTKARKLKKRS